LFLANKNTLKDRTLHNKPSQRDTSTYVPV